MLDRRSYARLDGLPPLWNEIGSTVEEIQPFSEEHYGLCWYDLRLRLVD